MGSAPRTGTASRPSRPPRSATDPAAAPERRPAAPGLRAPAAGGRPRRHGGTAGRRGGALAVAGLLVLGFAGLAACGPDDSTGSDDGKSSTMPSASAGATSPSAAGPGTGSTAPGKGGAKAPRSTVGSDGVTSWNPADLTRNHVTTTVHYPMTPPVGGDHAPVWMNCNGDVYTKPIPDMNAVHALEHGAVWVTYNASAKPADVKKLAALVGRTPYSLMSPYPTQQHPITLTAWGKQRTVQGADDPAVSAFFTAYVQGPQTPEPGASCTGGLAQ